MPQFSSIVTNHWIGAFASINHNNAANTISMRIEESLKTKSRAVDAGAMQSPTLSAVKTNCRKSRAASKGGSRPFSRGNRPADASKTLTGPLASLPRIHAAQLTGRNAKPRQAKFRDSYPAALEARSHGFVCHSRGEIPPRWATWSIHGTVRTTRRAAKKSGNNSVTWGRPSAGSSPTQAKRRHSVE